MNPEPYVRKAQYHETDRMGVIHHSNFIRWFEEARVDYMDKLGFSYARAEGEGIASPVLYISCEYKSMVRFGDAVRIRASIAELTGSRMTVRYRVEDGRSGELRAAGESRHCFINKEGRPVSLKKAIPALYELFLSVLEADMPD